MASRSPPMGGPLLSTHRAIGGAGHLRRPAGSGRAAVEHIIIWDKDARATMRGAELHALTAADRRRMSGIASDLSPAPGTILTPSYENGILGTLIWGRSDHSSTATPAISILASGPCSGEGAKAFGDSGARSALADLNDLPMTLDGESLDLTRSRRATSPYHARLVTTHRARRSSTCPGTRPTTPTSASRAASAVLPWPASITTAGSRATRPTATRPSAKSWPRTTFVGR